LKRRFSHIFATLGVAILTSCASLSYVDIQIGEPGKKELPSHIQSLTLVNRSVDDRFQDLSADSVQKIFKGRNFNLDTVLYDLPAADTVIKALGDLLYESGRYDIVIPQDRFISHENNMFFSVPMPMEEVKALCDTFHTDAVLSLDYFKTSIATACNDETVYDTEEFEHYKAYVALMAVKYEAILRVYDPLLKKVVNREVLTDTLFWYNADRIGQALFDNFTPVKNALSEAGVELALNYAEKISPIWRNETRRYFKIVMPGIEKADSLASANNWDEALNNWLAIIKDGLIKDKNLKSKLEFNIAVGYEMTGNIEEAIKWGIKSYNDFYRPLTVDYLNILKSRREEIDKIQKK
jgi:hypothetical protein